MSTTFAVAFTVEAKDARGKRWGVGFGFKSEDEPYNAIGELVPRFRIWVLYVKAQIQHRKLTNVEWKKNGKTWNVDEAMKPGSQPS